MNKFLKKLTVAVLILTVFLSCSVTSVYADADKILEYTFSFVDDGVNEYGASTTPQAVKVMNTAYVWQRYASAPTLYVLCLPTEDGSDVSITSWATNVVHNVTTTGTRSFTYNTGHGGTGEAYYLVGMPEAYDFDNYTVSGEWNA